MFVRTEQPLKQISSDSGDILLWVGVHRSALSVVRLHLLISFIVMMTREGFTKIVNFMIPWAGVVMLGRGHISHYLIVNIHYLQLYQYTAQCFY